MGYHSPSPGWKSRASTRSPKSKPHESESLRRGHLSAESEPEEGEEGPLAKSRWAEGHLCGRGSGSGDGRRVTHRGVGQVSKYNKGHGSRVLSQMWQEEQWNELQCSVGIVGTDVARGF